MEIICEDIQLGISSQVCFQWLHIVLIKIGYDEYLHVGIREMLQNRT